MILLLIWSIIYNVFSIDKIITRQIVPFILDMIENFKSLLYEKNLINSMGISLSRLIFGYIVSCIIGFIIGGVMIRFKILGNLLKGPFLALQTIPNVCLVPIASLLFGASEKSILFLIIVGTSFGVALGVENSIRSVESIYLKVGQTMGIKGFEMYRRIIIPGAIPNLIISLKSGWSFAWRALMSGEVINSTIGLGLLLKVGQTENNLALVMCIMLLIMIIGVVINRVVFEKIEGKINKKYGKE